MRTGRHALSAVLICAAAMTACTAGCTAAAELPSFEEASRQLDHDADTLLGAGLSGPAVRLRDDETCVPGQVRHAVRAEGDLAGSSDRLLERLGALGYDRVADDVDLRDDAEDVALFRNPRTQVTFELTLRPEDGDGVRVIGKTVCYATG
ncbi:hypothetical protein AB0K12_17755 [Nonomuraea sp. NPDC049419]|uniref:hypothetical protein n=1 Tax=Nonomuraea sp. NPDC049419 TaxID=3155772 RepID=UPI0034487E74